MYVTMLCMYVCRPKGLFHPFDFHLINLCRDKTFLQKGQEEAEILNLLVDLVGVHTKLGVRKERRSVIPESTNYSI